MMEFVKPLIFHSFYKVTGYRCISHTSQTTHNTAERTCHFSFTRWKQRAVEPHYYTEPRNKLFLSHLREKCDDGRLSSVRSHFFSQRSQEVQPSQPKTEQDTDSVLYLTTENKTFWLNQIHLKLFKCITHLAWTPLCNSSQLPVWSCEI